MPHDALVTPRLLLTSHGWVNTHHGATVVEALDELDAMIREEKLRVSDEMFSATWEEALAEGIEPGLVAEAAAHALFRQLHREAGVDAAKRLADEIALAIECGHYLPESAIQ